MGVVSGLVGSPPLGFSGTPIRQPGAPPLPGRQAEPRYIEEAMRAAGPAAQREAGEIAAPRKSGASP